MKNNILIILICIGCLNASPGASYQYGYSARSVSLSSAMVADTYHTFQSFSNPALLNQCIGKNYGLSYFMMSLDRSLQTFYYSQKLAGNAGLSAAILRTSVGEFMGKDSFNNPTNELSNSDYYGLLSFGVGTKKGSGVGLSMRIHYSNLYVNETHIDKYTGTSITVDFGGVFSVNSKFRLGFKMQNLLNPYINWDVDRGDGLSYAYDETYPLIISLGSRMELWEQSNLLIQKDLYLLDDNSNVYKDFFRLGYESFINDAIAFRIGVRLQTESKLSLGFGYKFDINQMPLILDYAVDLGSKGEGVSHLFTWSIDL
tara:strand:- start:991 stop:1932 length:942 start_codon:yes stop_codon:yes gene_type:complete